MNQTEGELEMESNSATTPLSVQVKAEEGVHNAVLWYETDMEGRGHENGKTIVKTKFEYALTEPLMSTFFFKDENLVTFLKSHVDPKAARAVLYSKEGWKNRNRIKKELEKGAETNALWLCFGTCGCAVCCGGCGGKCDKNTAKLNEDSYCSMMAEENPGHTTKMAYELLAPAPAVVEVLAIER